MTATPSPESYEFQKAAIKKLLDIGVNFIDTAENYLAGAAETSLGNVL
jgi:aryl-alcohol dehydrogenase-like predicted oxidoreductase